jgi:hypothetical protein
MGGWFWFWFDCRGKGWGRACDSVVEDMRYEDRCDNYDYYPAMVNLKFAAAEETGTGVRGKCTLRRVRGGGGAASREGGRRQLLMESNQGGLRGVNIFKNWNPVLK